MRASASMRGERSSPSSRRAKPASAAPESPVPQPRSSTRSARLGATPARPADRPAAPACDSPAARSAPPRSAGRIGRTGRAHRRPAPGPARRRAQRRQQEARLPGQRRRSPAARSSAAAAAAAAPAASPASRRAWASASSGSAASGSSAAACPAGPAPPRHRPARRAPGRGCAAPPHRPAPRQRRAQRHHRLGQPPGLGQGGAAIGQEDRLLRRCRQRAFRMPERAGGVAALPGQHAQQVMRVGLLRPALQHLPVQPLGRRQVAGGMARGTACNRDWGSSGRSAVRSRSARAHSGAHGTVASLTLACVPRHITFARFAAGSVRHRSTTPAS